LINLKKIQKVLDDILFEHLFLTSPSSKVLGDIDSLADSDLSLTQHYFNSLHIYCLLVEYQDPNLPVYLLNYEREIRKILYK
jgi:hypothetical protein